jgi:hypothetical protein
MTWLRSAQNHGKKFDLFHIAHLYCKYVRVVININVLSVIKFQAQEKPKKRKEREISTDVTMHAMRCDDDEVQVKVR